MGLARRCVETFENQSLIDLGFEIWDLGLFDALRNPRSAIPNPKLY